MKILRPQSKQPIPPHAKRVFKGMMFDVYQWEQEMYDGSKTTFEKLKRADTVSVIPVTSEGKIVLCKQEQPGTEPFISGFGGRVDEGEDVLEAAKRELREESGFTSEKFTLWEANQPSDKIEWAIYLFVANGAKKVSEPHTDPGENIEVFEATFDEFLKIVAQEDFRDIEVSLKVLHALQNPMKMDELKALLHG